MPLTLKLSSNAEQDLELAYVWYRNIHPNLGDGFKSSIDTTLKHIFYQPEAYAMVYSPYRRALVERFSYAVFFRIEKKQIIVSAILHTSRSPSLIHKQLTLH